MRSLILLLAFSIPALATEDYSKQLNLPCGQCHIDATGDGPDCLSGRWDKFTGKWAISPRPMWECGHSPGGRLTPLGQRWKDDDHSFK